MKFTPVLRAIATSGRRIPHPKDLALRVNTAKGVEEIVIRTAQGNPTGITTLYEHPNPRPALIKVYEHTLELLKSKYPESSIYRQSVENVIGARKKIIEENDVREVIESKIGCGLIEEILVQAADEYILAEKLAELKPWEELEEKIPEGQWTR